MLSDHETFLIRRVVARAFEGAWQLSIPQRADLFEGAALILEGEEADEASHLAQSLRESERAQADFFKQLGNPISK